MKLFIDDVRECPKGWDVARTVEDAIRILATSPVMITDVSLDYDAGSGTFESVAYFLREKFLNDTFFADDLEVQIHSDNPVGRKKLKDILEAYGVPVV